MTLRIRDLFEKVNKQFQEQLALKAGEGGISNLVSWFHIIEGCEIASFLEGGEIVVITGIALHENHESLLCVLQQCVNKGASGCIVNLGPYIETLDTYVLNFCEENCFPLFTAPWSMSMSKVARIIALEITHNMERRNELVSAFRNAIFFPSQQELYVPVLERYDYETDWHYCICMLVLTTPDDALPITKELLRKLRARLDNRLAFLAPEAAILRTHSDLLICFANRSEDSIEAVMQQLCENAISNMKKQIRIYIGIGRNTKSVRCIHKTYRIALQAARLQQRMDKPYDVLSYRKMGISRLFLSMSDTEIMKEYYDSMLKPLITYDTLNATDYTEFLQTYFDEGCHVQQVADKLFLHRNSIGYKLHKIEEILMCDLNDFETKVSLMLALKLRYLL